MCGMENVPYAKSPAATDEPAVPATPRSAGALSTARVSEALVAGAIEGVLHATADTHPGRAQRHDGWTPERITTFLSALAQCGCVEIAARAAGMTRQGAYALRNRAGGGAFALAWDAAVEQLTHARVADEVRSRALHGCVELIVRDGKVWGERHRFDNRLTMALLTRLDAKRDSRREEDIDTRIVAGEFDQFVAIAARGDVDAAAAFLADRRDAGWTNCEQARLLTRLGNYQRYGVGLPEEIPVTDLDSTDPADWTEEQVERARRAEILEEEEDEAEEEPATPTPLPSTCSWPAWSTPTREARSTRKTRNTRKTRAPNSPPRPNRTARWQPETSSTSPRRSCPKRTEQTHRWQPETSSTSPRRSCRSRPAPAARMARAGRVSLPRPRLMRSPPRIARGSTARCARRSPLPPRLTARSATPLAARPRVNHLTFLPAREARGEGDRGTRWRGLLSPDCPSSGRLGLALPRQEIGDVAQLDILVDEGLADAARRG